MYFRIYDWMLNGLGLRGNELLVYAYLYMWHESGRQVYLHQWQMAKEICIPAETFSRVLKRLQGIGLLKGLCIDETSIRILTKCQDGNEEKIDETSIKIDETSRKKLTKRQDGIDETSSIHINKNINKNINKRVDVDARAHTRESEKLDEMAMMGVVEDIRQLAAEVKEEISNGGTIAESARRLYALNGEQLAEYVDYFVDWVAMRGETLKSRSDFRRHFNAWLRIQLSEKIKNQQNGAKNNSINDGGEGNARISAGYVQELMRKAGLAIQSGGNQ